MSTWCHWWEQQQEEEQEQEQGQWFWDASADDGPTCSGIADLIEIQYRWSCVHLNWGLLLLPLVGLLLLLSMLGFPFSGYMATDRRLIAHTTNYPAHINGLGGDVDGGLCWHQPVWYLISVSHARNNGLGTRIPSSREWWWCGGGGQVHFCANWSRKWSNLTCNYLACVRILTLDLP